MAYSTVLLDLDHTLFDTHASEAAAFATTIATKTRRFSELLADLGLAGDAAQLAEAFAVGLGRHGELYPGARAVLDELRSVASLALITNGLSEVQRARIPRLGLTDCFDAVVISAEVGVSKPDPAIFSLVFDQLGTVLGPGTSPSGRTECQEAGLIVGRRFEAQKVEQGGGHIG